MIFSYIDAFKDSFGSQPRSMRFENIETGITNKVDFKEIDRSIIDESITSFIRGIRQGAFSPCQNDFQCSRCEFKDKCHHWKTK